MDTFEAIMSRRSIRKYTSQTVSEQDTKELLMAAMNAPSARNDQPWHFIVINDRKVLDEITKFHPYAPMLKEAPLAILVCGDLGIDPTEGYNVVNCSAATQNLLLAAHAKGLGAVWLGIYPRQERIAGIKKLFALPDNILPVSLVSIGWPAETKPKEIRYKQDRVRHNKW